MEKEELERLAGGRLRLTFDEINNHPNLPSARKAYLDSFCALYERDPFLVRLLLQAGRFFVFHIAAILDARQDLSRRETWFTVTALKKQLSMFGFASSRQIDHLVGRLCEVGFLVSSRAPTDGRVRLLETTNKLRDHHTAWLATHYLPLSILFPDHDYGPALARDQEFHVVHCHTCLPFHGISARLMMMLLPETLLFFRHAAGPLIQNALLKAAMDAGELTAAVSHLDAADRFGVSRTHVQNIIVEAQNAGLVNVVERRRIEILPRFWASYDRGLSLGMYLHDVVNIVAMRAWTRPKASAETDRACS